MTEGEVERKRSEDAIMRPHTRTHCAKKGDCEERDTRLLARTGATHKGKY